MATLGTRVIVHNKPGNNLSWGHNGTLGWCIGPYLYHYRCMQCYIPTTGIVRITDTLQYIPKVFAFPKATTGDYLRQEIGYIIANIKNPSKTIPFLSYGDVKQINQPDCLHFTKKHSSFPHIHYTLPTMLPKSQNKKIQPPEITSIPEPALRVELVSQSPWVKP